MESVTVYDQFEPFPQTGRGRKSRARVAASQAAWVVARDAARVVAGLAAGQATPVAASQALQAGARVVAREKAGVGVLGAA
jgi:hypothetical protein